MSAITIALFIKSVSAQNIFLTNDDGWAVAQIRAQRDALVDAGFNVRLRLFLSSPELD